MFARSGCSALEFGKQAAGLLGSRLNDSLESQFKLGFNSELARCVRASWRCVQAEPSR